MQNAARLGFQMRKDNLGVVLFQLADKLNQNIGAAGIDDRNLTHAEDQDFRHIVHLAEKH